MKTKLLISMFLVTLFIKKNQAQVQLNTKSDVVHYLTDNWNWVQSCGGIAATCYTPLSEGYTHSYIFSSIPGTVDSIHFQEYYNGAIIKEQNTAIDTLSDNSFSGIGKWVLKNLNDQLAYDPITDSTFNLPGTKKIIGFGSTQSVLFLITETSDYITSRYYRSTSVNITENTSESNLTLFPNPSNGELNIKGIIGEHVTIQITDLKGSTVYTGIHAIETEKINLSQDLKNGIYFFKILSVDSVHSGKILIEK